MRVSSRLPPPPPARDVVGVDDGAVVEVLDGGGGELVEVLVGGLEGLAEVDVVDAVVLCDVVVEVGDDVVGACVVVGASLVDCVGVDVGGALLSLTPARGGNCSTFCPRRAPSMKSVHIVVG